jgi:hypothetical protein
MLFIGNLVDDQQNFRIQLALQMDWRKFVAHVN